MYIYTYIHRYICIYTHIHNMLIDASKTDGEQLLSEDRFYTPPPPPPRGGGV